MRLSVALATYQGQRWLPALLDSLAGQTRLPDELVVCDDASSDGTRAVLDDFAEAAPFTVRRVDHDVRRGPVRAFETALEAVEGGLIALADQDDRWDHDKLAVLEAALTGHDVVMAFSDARMVDADGRPTADRLWSELGFRRRAQDSLATSPPGPLLRQAVASGCTMAFRRRLLAAALPFPAVLDLVAEPVLHDRWLALLAGCAGRVVPVPATLIDYRVHPAQVVGARWVGARSQVRGQAARSVADVSARAQAGLRRLDVLEARLGRLPEPPSIAVLQQLGDLRRHLETRASLGGRWSRLPAVLGEVLTGGYRRFGGGVGSAILDMIRT